MKMHMIDFNLMDMGFCLSEEAQNSQSLHTNVWSKIARFDQVDDFQIGACTMRMIVMIGRCMMRLQGFDIMTMIIRRMMMVTMTMAVIVVMMSVSNLLVRRRQGKP